MITVKTYTDACARDWFMNTTFRRRGWFVGPVWCEAYMEHFVVPVATTFRTFHLTSITLARFSQGTVFYPSQYSYDFN